MKSVSSFSRWTGYGAALALLLAASAAQAAVGKAVVRAVRGTASYSEQGGDWKPLKAGKVLDPGSSVKTGVASQVDLFLDENGPIVRVIEDSTLGIDKLDVDRTGAETVIETQLDLRQGTIQGVVKKLAAASKYEVRTPTTVAGIRGTEYEISANGVSHVIVGSVQIAYTNPVTKKISTHLVNEGQTFIPPTAPETSGATPTVRGTRPGETHPRIEVIGGPAPVVVISPRTEPFVSPVISN
jgi:hypothetical protein